MSDMSIVISQIKAVNGYTEAPRKCTDCASFEPDDSTDHFGPGDLCGRNRDVKFKVRSDSVCNKWERKP